MAIEKRCSPRPARWTLASTITKTDVDANQRKTSVKENNMATKKQHRIVFAVDGSRTAEAALATALKFPWPASSNACAVVARSSSWLPAASEYARPLGHREWLSGCRGRGPPHLVEALAGIEGRHRRRDSCRSRALRGKPDRPRLARPWRVPPPARGKRLEEHLRARTVPRAGFTRGGKCSPPLRGRVRWLPQC